MAKCGVFLACIKKYTQQLYLSHVLTSYLHCFSCSDSHVPPRSQGSGADRRCGRDRCHSGGFLLRIMPPSWHPVPACSPRRRCRRAILLCSNDGAASIPKFGPEIKNRCTQKGLNREKLASIPKSGPEIKNRCTQQCINGENLASILKSASRGFDSGGRAGADAPGGGISLCFCRRGCAAPAQKAATLNDHCRRGQSMERTVRSLPETVK